MKKLIFAAFVALLVLGCTKENTSSPLVGTKWVMSWDDAKEIVEFTSDTDVRIYEADENLNFSDFLHEGKYVYANGVVTFQDNKLCLTDVWGLTKCYYYYFQSASINGDVLVVNTTCKKLVIEDLSTGDYTLTDAEGKEFTFMKVE